MSASSLVRGAERIANLDGRHAIDAGIWGRMALHAHMNDRRWTRQPLYAQSAGVLTKPEQFISVSPPFRSILCQNPVSNDGPAAPIGAAGP